MLFRNEKFLVGHRIEALKIIIKQTLDMFIIFRSDAEGFLKGPFSEETASENINGDHSSVILDSEIVEAWLDEEDMDFQEDDENIDFMSELKVQVA